jgi:predicted nucleic acid-binding protein
MRSALTPRSISYQLICPREAVAWHLWKSRPDKEWSLVDCSSFIVMQQRGLTEALTTDHHFAQVGFIRLLK